MHNNKLTIIEFANQKLDYSGMDNIKECLDKKLFRQWPHPVNYNYNSRGFRDLEWPQDLNSAVWCIGDSFTVGIGSCFEHTWPQLLSQHSQRRVINVSMDGASNEWIARQACDAYDLARPRNMVLMWSYLHRRENINRDQSDLDRRLHSVRSTTPLDFENFNSCRKRVHAHCASSNIIELVVPNFITTFDDAAWKRIRDPSWPQLLPPTLVEFQDLSTEIAAEMRTLHSIDIDQLLEFYTILQQNPEYLADVIRVEYLDRARDGHHFDKVTADWVAKQVQNLLNL
jgi:hypothetical protein